MVARTGPMSRAEIHARQQHAHAFLAAAALVVEFGADAGIDDVGKSSTDGTKLAPHLHRLVGSKTDAQYSPTLMTTARSESLLTAARRLVDGMDRVLRDLS